MPTEPNPLKSTRQFPRVEPTGHCQAGYEPKPSLKRPAYGCALE
jgi:hypothetical protein